MGQMTMSCLIWIYWFCSLDFKFSIGYSLDKHTWKFYLLNPIALRTAKTLWSFDYSECNRVKVYWLYLNPIALTKAKIVYNYDLSECSSVNLLRDHQESLTHVLFTSVWCFLKLLSGFSNIIPQCHQPGDQCLGLGAGIRVQLALKLTNGLNIYEVFFCFFVKI